MSEYPKVSVLCISYNQAQYIRQTLDSFLMQRTDFSFEVLINDDASTDGTAEIIKQYQKKYPDIIKPVLQKKNQYSQGVRNMMVRFLLPKARGRFIAICEGDDFWTDPSKLQQQVDFLENHPDYSLVFHPVRVFFEKGERKESIFPENTSGFTVGKLLERNFIQTNSVMYRAQPSYDTAAVNVMPGDWYLHLYHAQFGKIGFINRAMSAYRRHSGGIWWDEVANRKRLLETSGIYHLQLFSELMNLYGHKSKKYREVISNKAAEYTEAILDLDLDYLSKEVAERFPDYISLAMRRKNERIAFLTRKQERLTETGLHLAEALKGVESKEQSQSFKSRVSRRLDRRRAESIVTP